MSPEHVIALIAALTPTALSLMAGIGWIVRRRVEQATPPGVEPPTTQTLPAALAGTVPWLQQQVTACQAECAELESERDTERAARIHAEVLLLRHGIDHTPPPSA